MTNPSTKGLYWVDRARRSVKNHKEKQRELKRDAKNRSIWMSSLYGLKTAFAMLFDCMSSVNAKF